MIVTVVMLLLLGMLEFGFIFDHHLTLEYADPRGRPQSARRWPTAAGRWAAARPVAECRHGRQADHRRRPARPHVAGFAVVVSRITEIRIYKSDANGDVTGTSSNNVWTYDRAGRGGPIVDGRTARLQPTGPPAGAPARATTTARSPRLDRRERHATTTSLVTPLSAVMGFFGAGTGPTAIPITDRTVMALNPGKTDHAKLLDSPRRAGRSSRPDRRSSSRSSIIAFVGLCAVVVDVSWYWANSLRMQRAADAAALAGVVCLPGDDATAIDLARAEAAKNGYTNGVGGVTVDAARTARTTAGCDVTISGRVGTFFARVMGISHGHAATRGDRPSTSCPSRWAARRTTTASSAWSRHADGRRPAPSPTNTATAYDDDDVHAPRSATTTRDGEPDAISAAGRQPD